jgi:cellulose synthase operon protein C
MRISLSPLSGSPASEGIGHAVDTLRAELDACSHHTQKALLHYELALLFEQVRDDHSAAKELLLAVNGDSTLHEPLEHLIALMERRRSYVNLGKLLDRLGRIAHSKEQSVRAQLARGDYMVDQRADLVGALAAYEQASALSPDNSLVWLSLHYLGARQSDAKLVEAALTRRIELAHHRGYRDSLRLQLARFQAMRGRQDLARATVEAATSPHSPVLYPALLQLEQLGLKLEDYAPRAALLDQQAEVLSRGLEDADHARARGLPASHLDTSRLIDVTLRAIVNFEAAPAKGSRALDALDRAFLFAPHNRVLVRALQRLEVDSTPTKQERLLALAQTLDHAGPEELDASLWLDQAMVAHGNDDIPLFKQFVAQALRHSPTSVVARALQLETYWANRDFADLALAYEQLGAQLPDSSSQAHAYLLAAVAHVLAAEPKERAIAALHSAAARGERKIEHWHTVLAHLHDDPQWAQEALRRQAHVGGALETSARLVAVRQAVQEQDSQALNVHLEALSREPRSQRIALLLRATIPLSHTDEAARIAALQSLSTLVDGELRLGLQRWVAEQKRQHGQAAMLQADLLALHEAAPSDTTTTLELVPLLLDADDPESAVRVLTATAQAHPTPETQQLFHSYAGIVAHRAGATDTALRSFTSASQGPSSGCLEPLRWALRASLPNDPATRRKVLDLSTPSQDDRTVVALERFALEVGFGNQKSAATDALSNVDDLSFDEVGEAIQLARALWTECPQHHDALRHLQTQGTLGRQLAAAATFYDKRAELGSSTETLLASVEEWAAHGSLAATLEWLGVALNAGDAQAETKARQALALELDAPLSVYSSAESTLVELFAGLSPQPMKPDNQAARLVNAELSSPMTSPESRALALAGLVDVFEADAGSNYDSTLRVMAAYNHLANQDFDAAKTSFEVLATDDPSDVVAWEGLVECARGLMSLKDEAHALLQVGTLHGDIVHAVAALRQAASYFLDHLNEPELGYQCLARAVELDISDTQAFARLLKHAKTELNHEQIITLASARLSVAESAKELTKLHWERARAYRALNNLDQALADLGNVAILDPEHVGAKALAGDIYISQQDFRSAANELSELALLPNAPLEQRRLGAITAIDLFEGKLFDIDSALELFSNLTEANLDLLPVAERLLSACVKAARWEETLVLSGYLSTNLPLPSGRAEAARLQLAVHRDELKQPDRALLSVKTLLTESPGDPEAVDILLDETFGRDTTQTLLHEHLDTILAFAARSTDVEDIARVARVAEELDDLELRLVALGAFVGRVGTEGDTLRELDQLLGHTAPYPSVTKPLDMSSLVHELEHGPLIAILRLLAPHLPEVWGPTVSSLGLGRKERRNGSDAQAVRPYVSAWTTALGLRDFEFYLVPQRNEPIAAVAAPKEPAIIISGADRSLTPFERGRLAASIFGLVRGTYACLEHSATKVAALLSAACKIGGVVLDGPTFELTNDLERQLSRELPRRVRKDLEPFAELAAQQSAQPLTAVHAAQATLDRIAALASGDLSQALVTRDKLSAGFSELDADLQERFQQQSEFCLTPTYLHLRRELGLSAK